MRGRYYLIIWIFVTILVMFLFPLLAMGVWHLIRYGEYVNGAYIREYYIDFLVNGLITSFIIAAILSLFLFMAIEG
ncbi:MAG: hypothetical protein ACFE9T_16355 [Promethearchaeota archaeon]